VNKWWSVLFGAMMLACLGLFVVAPSVGWWLPKNVSTFGGDVDALFYFILAITGFFFVLTEALLVYFMYVYAGEEGSKARPAPAAPAPDEPPSLFAPILRPIARLLHDQHRVEMAWTIVPAVILLIIAFAQIRVWENIKDPTNMPRDPDVGLEVSARLFEWRVRYPNTSSPAAGTRDGNVFGLTASQWQNWASNDNVDDLHLVNEIHVWKHVDDENPCKVKVFLKTRDVIHSFYLPNLRLKQDALPGKTIPVWFSVVDYNTVPVDKDGKRLEIGDPRVAKWVDGYDGATGKFNQPHQTWEIACAELCGWGHYKMRGKLFVHETKQDFLNWLARARAQQNSIQQPP
jgi:cytochrome c oxidase subunit 2